MGIYDRDYYQEDYASSRGYGSGRSMVINLIIINVAIAILDVFTPEVGNRSHWLTEAMACPSNLFSQPWNVWKLLTAGFAHQSLSAPGGIWHVAWNMYALWLFGRAVESVYGSREFLRIYLAFLVGSNLIWVLAHGLTAASAEPQVYYLVGASGATTAITILFVLHFPHQKFLLLFFPMPIPAWVLGIIIVGADLLGAAGLHGDNIAFAAHLGGAGLAVLYFRSGIRLTQWFQGWRWPSWQGRPRLRVHREPRVTEDLERKADAILEKINKLGADSISAEERRILNDYSRKMRQKHS